MIKIYFTDLIYDNGLVSCDFIPLGCGYVAAYAKALCKTKADVQIFKYPDSFLKTAKKSPPDIFAGSCYAWNKNLVLLVSRFIKKINPQCLIVLGGVAFPLDAKRQKEFLLNNKHIDFLVPYDGEIGFGNILKEYFTAAGDKERMKKAPIVGSTYLNAKGEIVAGEKIQRPKDLDVFPSPYLTGLFDKFLNDKFTPIVQTTRGCPYACSYCWASNKQNKNIAFFSLERVKAELNYIAERTSKNNIYDLLICDSNFGLYKKDCTVLDFVYDLQQKYNYPKIFATPHANKTHPEYADHFSRLKGITYCLSTQSTNPKILKNVNRQELDFERIRKYIKGVHSRKKYILTEIITGLPYETRETHMATLRDLLDCGFDLVEPFTLMLLDGIELDSEEAHRKFKYDIRYRLIPRNFGKVSGEHCFEIERVVVGTNTYDFNDYIYFRSLHGLLRLFLNNDIYKELLQYVKEHNIHPMDWFAYVFDDLRNNPSDASKCFNLYIKEALSELWNSPEELIRHYSKEENYKKLLSRECGDNLMQKYSILASSIHFDTYVNYICRITGRYLTDRYKGKRHKIQDEIDDIRKFILAKLSGVLVNDIQKTKSFSIKYNILEWIKNEFKRPLSFYKLTNPKKLTAQLSDEQIELIKEIFKRYNVDENNPYGLYRTSVLVRVDNYFRKIK